MARDIRKIIEEMIIVVPPYHPLRSELSVLFNQTITLAPEDNSYWSIVKKCLDDYIKPLNYKEEWEYKVIAIFTKCTVKGVKRYLS